MNMFNFSAALLSAGLLMAAPAFAQSTTPAQKQPTQEGGSFSPLPCGEPYNANPSADPDCKQRTQNLVPSAGQASIEASTKQK